MKDFAKATTILYIVRKEGIPKEYNANRYKSLEEATSPENVGIGFG